MLSWKGLAASEVEVPQPGSLHIGDQSDCDAASETEDGCESCQEEIEEVEELIMRRFKRNGREVVATFYQNIAENDGYWEFAVASKPL